MFFHDFISKSNILCLASTSAHLFDCTIRKKGVFGRLFSRAGLNDVSLQIKRWSLGLFSWERHYSNGVSLQLDV